MNDFTSQDMLQLDVIDFGPIIEAKIELRPLTVFVGPSNTGKSYLAILIYALHRYFGDDVRSDWWRFPWRHGRFQGRESRKLPHEAIDELIKWTEKTFVENGEVLKGKKISLPDIIRDIIQAEFKTQGPGLNYEIGRCFGLGELEALIRKGTSNRTQISFLKHFSRNTAPVKNKFTIKSHETEFITTIPEDMTIMIDDRDGAELAFHEFERWHHLAHLAGTSKRRHHEMGDFEISQLIEALASLALPSILGPLHRPAFYLPADRTGVMHAHNVVVSTLIESAAMAGLRPAVRSPTLSGVLADFLERLIELDHLPSSLRNSRNDLGKALEEDILGGTVDVNRTEGISYPRFTYRPEGWKDDLPLMNASSMISELAPVVLYLRHMVRPGDLLIIEEPESHLHPAMQVAFTKQIAALVNSEIRLIVTTHSEWLLEELANIVRRSKLPEAKKIGSSGSEVALRPDQVGAWLFEPKGRPRGSMVKEIRLDESGLYPSGFDEVAMALHNEWADISSKIEDAE